MQTLSEKAKSVEVLSSFNLTRIEECNAYKSAVQNINASCYIKLGGLPSLFSHKEKTIKRLQKALLHTLVNIQKAYSVVCVTLNRGRFKNQPG